MVRSTAKAVLAGSIALAWAGAAGATVTTYQGAAGLTAFNAAAGSPPIAINFEDLSGDIAGTTVRGVTFSSPDGNTLDVVPGASTFTPPGFSGVGDPDTNRLFPTSGANVLSPGGLELAPGPDARQDDSLDLRFATPMSAFGLDILFQSYDCCTFVHYRVFNFENVVLAEGDIAGNGGGGGDPGGSSFFGVYSDTGNIRRIVFNETDANDQFPDANIGYDTFRFGAAVPEPATWATMILGFGLAGAAVRRRRLAV